LSTNLYLGLFDWASLQSPMAAIELHTLPNLRDPITAIIHSDGRLGDVNVLDVPSFEVGAFQVMDRGDVESSRLHALRLRVRQFLSTSEIAVKTRI
jgi:hypothetical protein